MASVCSNCSSTRIENEIINSETQSICIDCGTVVDSKCEEFVSPSIFEVQDASTNYVEADGTTNIAANVPNNKRHLCSRNRNPPWKKGMRIRLSEVVNTMNIPTTLEEEIRHFLFEIVCNCEDALGLTAKRNKSVAVGSCIYIISCQNKHPTSLECVAQKCDVHISELKRMVYRITCWQEIVLTHFVAEDFLEVMYAHVDEKCREIARNVTTLLRNTMVITSHPPVPTALALLAIVIQYTDKITTHQAIKGKLAPLCSTWRCSETVVHRQVLHITSYLLSIAVKIPWFSKEQVNLLVECGYKVKTKRVCSVLPDILRYSEVTDNNIIKCGNNARIKNDAILKRRQEKITAAKRRISENYPGSKDNHSDEKELDWEDIKIEELLMKGFTENEILPGYYDTLDAPVEMMFDSNGLRAELDNEDIAEEDLTKFIRSSEEVDILKTVKAT